MARNKYPEETVQKILDVSLKLFMEQGYAHTTIQNIIDHLGGLSKGAIYHHFKSKEEIFFAISERMEAQSRAWMDELKGDVSKSGLEKLRQLFRRSLVEPSQTYFSQSGVELLDHPKLMEQAIRGWVSEAVPQYVQPFLEEGIRDGTITTQYPQEVGEVLMLLINLWMDPAPLGLPPDSIGRRLRFLDELLRAMGVPLFDEALRKDMLDYVERWNERCAAPKPD